MGVKNKTSFKKGEINNPDGRPVGAKNKKTLAWEKLGEYIIGEGAEKYSEYLNTLDDKKFADEFRAIIEYFKPRQMRTEIKADVNVEPKKIGFEE